MGRAVLTARADEFVGTNAQEKSARFARSRKTIRDANSTNDSEWLGDSASGFFEEFVDEGLVGFGLLGGHAAELAQQLRGDANGDELFCVSRNRAADSAGAAQFGISRFRDVGEVKLAIRHGPGALCGSPGAR